MCRTVGRAGGSSRRGWPCLRPPALPPAHPPGFRSRRGDRTARAHQDGEFRVDQSMPVPGIGRLLGHVGIGIAETRQQASAAQRPQGIRRTLDDKYRTAAPSDNNLLTRRQLGQVDIDGAASGNDIRGRIYGIDQAHPAAAAPMLAVAKVTSARKSRRGSSDAGMGAAAGCATSPAVMRDLHVSRAVLARPPLNLPRPAHVSAVIFGSRLRIRT